MKTNNRISMQGVELVILKSLISPSRSIKEADQNTIKEPDKGFGIKVDGIATHPRGVVIFQVA